MVGLITRHRAGTPFVAPRASRPVLHALFVVQNAEHANGARSFKAVPRDPGRGRSNWARVSASSRGAFSTRTVIRRSGIAAATILNTLCVIELDCGHRIRPAGSTHSLEGGASV